jgi:hypothetical protein
MPVIRSSSRWNTEIPRETLVDQLTKELIGDAQAQGPHIFEVRIKDNGTFHVIVVWDAWEGVSPEDRSSIILDGYEKRDEVMNDEEPMAPQITLVVGATVDEAIQQRLLPYMVEPTISGVDIPQKIQQAMRKEGAIEFVPGHPHLAFPSRQMADEAFQRLTKEVPEGNWHRHDERG